jgi:hypothetical protein
MAAIPVYEEQQQPLAQPGQGNLVLVDKAYLDELEQRSERLVEAEKLLNTLGYFSGGAPPQPLQAQMPVPQQQQQKPVPQPQMPVPQQQQQKPVPQPQMPWPAPPSPSQPLMQLGGIGGGLLGVDPGEQMAWGEQPCQQEDGGEQPYQQEDGGEQQQQQEEADDTNWGDGGLPSFDDDWKETLTSSPWGLNDGGSPHA